MIRPSLIFSGKFKKFPFNYSILFTVVLAALLAITSCGENKTGISKTEQSNANLPEEGEIHIYVSIAPQRYFVKQIGKNRVTISVLVPPGEEPHSYNPSPKQITALSDADSYFRIGVNFEEVFLPKIKRTLSNLPIMDLRKDVSFRTFSADADKSLKGSRDPHIWLGPPQVKTIAANILNSLISLDPKGETVYKENYGNLLKKIEQLDSELKKILSPLTGKTLLVFHPAFGYFADAYNLNQIAIETGGHEPTASRMEAIIKKAKQNNVKVIFVQPQFASDAANNIAQAINGTVVKVNPLAENWYENMQQISDKIKRGLQ